MIYLLNSLFYLSGYPSCTGAPDWGGTHTRVILDLEETEGGYPLINHPKCLVEEAVSDFSPCHQPESYLLETGIQLQPS